MNDQEALAEINKVIDAYIAGRITLARAMSRITWAAGKNAAWRRAIAA